MGRKSEGLTYTALGAREGSHQLSCLCPRSTAGAGSLNYRSMPTVSLDGRWIFSRLTTTPTGKTL